MPTRSGTEEPTYAFDMKDSPKTLQPPYDATRTTIELWSSPSRQQASTMLPREASSLAKVGGYFTSQTFWMQRPAAPQGGS